MSTRLTDERLAEIVSTDAWRFTILGPTAQQLARELLTARKVVEAARELQKCERDLFIGSAGMLNVREASLKLTSALTALDAAKEKP